MYKSGDKVVVEIDDTRQQCFNTLYLTKSTTLSRMFLNDDNILGKLEDFQPAEEKIQMTVEEKAEFDDLYPDTFQDVSDFLNDIYNFPDNYPNLKKRLYSNDRTNNFHSQIEFVKALEKPNLIEVEKEKKYYVHLFKSQKFGYLNQIRVSLELIVSDKNETDKCKTQFTKDEIEKFEDLGFKINDDALEEVEDE